MNNILLQKLAEKTHELEKIELALTIAQQELKTMQAELHSARLALKTTQQRLDVVENSLSLMQKSFSWRLTAPLRFIRQNPFKPVKLTETSVRDKQYQAELQAILQQYHSRPIIIFKPFIDWDIPLRQRPQHLAKALAQQGFLYFFCTPNAARDNINGFVSITHGGYLTNQFTLLSKLKCKKIYHVYSTDVLCDLKFMEQSLRKGDCIIYECVDQHHQDILKTTDATQQAATHEKHLTL